MDPIEQFLSRLHHPALASIDMSLDRMHRLLAMLGSPQRRLPPVIHVAGTNGKGSTIAYLKAIFEAAGKRVHVYSSPHLVQFRERIVVQGEMVENSRIEALVKHVAPVLAQQPATFFEATTALAFLAFAEKPADILLLETGMGGRLDATNVVEKPLLTVITPIDYDHMEYLGDTLEKIATEKAGIMKRGVPCVIGKQRDEAKKILQEKATSLGVSLIESSARGLAVQPALLGAHQFDNAATAVACIDQLPQFGIADEHILQGIKSAIWPARLQKLTHGEYVNILPKHTSLWLDGGHNEQGGRVLAAWLAEQQKPIDVVCGMVGKKDAEGYLRAIAPHIRSLYAVSIPSEPTSKKPAEIVQAAQRVGIQAIEEASIEQALLKIKEITPQSGLVAIIGSLYLAGFVLQKSS